MDGAWLKKAFERLRRWRYFSAALYGTLILLAVLCYGAGDGWFHIAPRAGPVQAEATLEERLEDILSTVRGAGRVRVLITYSTAGERVAATVSTLDESVCRLDSECMKWQQKAEESEQEVMRLKAMLFDLMFGKKVAG